MSDKITGIILAGGKSSRMGTDKALVNFQGKMLIEYSIALMKSFCDEVIISANNPDYKIFGLPVIKDNFNSTGPIGGIEAGLSYTKTEHNLVISCDTPFVNLNVFQEILGKRKAELAVIPRLSNNKIEPLTAYYSKKILPFVKAQIESKQYKLADLFKLVNMRYLDLSYNNFFTNLNTTADIKYSYSKEIIKKPNFILIAGDGRNVGKTFLASKIISQLSTKNKVIGVKVSPHFHKIKEENVIVKNEKYIILEEKTISTKDSSLMLQAGAKKVFYIMAKQENLREAFIAINDQLEDCPVVCESGGLHEFIHPGLFLFVKKLYEPIVKKHYLKFLPIIIENNFQDYFFDKKSIEFENKQITYRNINATKLKQICIK